MPQSSRHTTSVNGSSGPRSTHTNTQQSRPQRSQTDPTFRASGHTTLDSCFRRSRRSNTTGNVKQPVRFSDYDKVHYFSPLEAASRRFDDDSTTRNEQPTTEDWRNPIRDPAASYDDVVARPEPKERRKTTSAISGPSYQDTYESDGIDMMSMSTEEAMKEILPSIAEPWVKLITTFLSISSDGSARRAHQGVPRSRDERDRDDQRHDARRARPAHRGRDETTPSSPDDRASTSSRRPPAQYATSPDAPPLSGGSSRQGLASQLAPPSGAGSPRCTETSRTVTEQRTTAYPIETVGRDGSLRVEHITVNSEPVQINEYHYRDPRHSSDDIIRVEKEISDVGAKSRYAPSSRYTPTKGQPGYVSPERQDVERERLSITIRDQPRQPSERTSPPGHSQRNSEYGAERPDNSGRDRPQGKRADSSYFPSDKSYTNGNHSPREHAQRSDGRFSPKEYENAPRHGRQGSSHSTKTSLSPIENGVKYVQDQDSRPPMDRRRGHTRESELNWGRKDQNSSIDKRRPSYAKSAISASPQSYSPTSTVPSSPSRMTHDHPVTDQRTSHAEGSSASRAYRPQETFPRARESPPNGDRSRRQSLVASPTQSDMSVTAAPRPSLTSVASRSSRVSEQPTHSRKDGKKSSIKPAYDDPDSDVDSTAGVSRGKGRTGMDESERRRLEHRRMSMFQNDVEAAEKPRK
ncbi:hypothetical protein B9479_000577 [Cryptococcus floricola]|uniref:Uncharacterized protein n=1 Tax=Cryptococcus floricola TaxID=2591691 RepID=A0A5D3B801_9TREE|nr:hypothetical protein B9479_000577 [Cryptococcus floricola]